MSAIRCEQLYLRPARRNPTTEGDALCRKPKRRTDSEGRVCRSPADCDDWITGSFVGHKRFQRVASLGANIMARDRECGQAFDCGCGFTF